MTFIKHFLLFSNRNWSLFNLLFLLSPTCSGASSAELTQPTSAAAQRVVFKHCVTEPFIWFQKSDLIKAQLNPCSKHSQTPAACSTCSPPSHSDRLPKHNPQSACAPVFKEEEGECGDYDLYGTEHCLQVSLFNEKQNNPSGTQSTVLWALWGKRALSIISQNTANNYSTDFVFLSSKISGFLEASFLFWEPLFFCLAFCHLFKRFLSLFPHIHLCCYRFASANEAEAEIRSPRKGRELLGPLAVSMPYC